MFRFIICNLFHRDKWIGVRGFERSGVKSDKPIHCLICDGPLVEKEIKADKEIEPPCICGNQLLGHFMAFCPRHSPKE